MDVRTPLSAGPFEAMEARFWSACRGPQPLTLTLPSGSGNGGLPTGLPVVLPTLREALLGGSSPAPRIDPRRLALAGVVWRQLLERVRAEPEQWLPGVAGMLLPCLRRKHAMLLRGVPRAVGRDSAASVELETAMLSGLYVALAAIDPAGVDAGRVPARLCWAAYRAGRRVRDSDSAWERLRGGQVVDSQMPPAPYGHPDLILDHAVTGGLITKAEADLIGRTRLEDDTLAQVAAELGVGVHALRCRRLRAEARLAGALVDGTLSRYGYWPSAGSPPPARRRLRPVHRAVAGHPARRPDGGSQARELHAA
jgi:hypothetical protein